MNSHRDGHRPTLREIASAWAFCGALFLLIVLVPIINASLDRVTPANLLQEAKTLLDD